MRNNKNSKAHVFGWLAVYVFVQIDLNHLTLRRLVGYLHFERAFYFSMKNHGVRLQLPRPPSLLPGSSLFIYVMNEGRERETDRGMKEPAVAILGTKSLPHQVSRTLYRSNVVYENDEGHGLAIFASIGCPSFSHRRCRPLSCHSRQTQVTG